MPLLRHAFHDAGQTAKLICRAIITEATDAKSFVFAIEDGTRLPFEPGQFMTFAFRVGGRPEPRCYSISSSAGRDASISITLKRVKGGIVSNWLHDEFRVGDRVEAEGPFGLFTPAEHVGSPLLFLSAGSGITPLASTMRSFVDLALDPDVCFVHFARSPEDMIFAEEMRVWSKALRRARMMAVASQPRPGSGWVGPTGRLNSRLLAALVPDLARRTVFCCGPQAFMETAKSAALEGGVQPDCFHQESFTAFEPAGEAADGEPEPQPVAFDIEFTKSKRSTSCASGTTVLKAGQAAKVSIQNSCGKGLCGTCRIKLVSGRVQMNHNGGIKQREIDQGWILACCSKPISDLVIDR